MNRVSTSSGSCTSTSKARCRQAASPRVGPARHGQHVLRHPVRRRPPEKQLVPASNQPAAPSFAIRVRVRQSGRAVRDEDFGPRLRRVRSREKSPLGDAVDRRELRGGSFAVGWVSACDRAVRRVPVPARDERGRLRAAPGRWQRAARHEAHDADAALPVRELAASERPVVAAAGAGAHDLAAAAGDRESASDRNGFRLAGRCSRSHLSAWNTRSVSFQRPVSFRVSTRAPTSPSRNETMAWFFLRYSSSMNANSASTAAGI